MKIKKLLTILFAVLAMTLTSAFVISCTGTGTTTSEKESEITSVEENQSEVESEESVNATEANVVFDVNTDLATNVVRSRVVKIGKRVSEPKLFITGDNPTNLQVYGWYTSPECTDDTKWDFKNGRVAGDMTLYAKWVELYDVNYVVNGELHSTINVFNGDYVEETAEIVMGYKYLGSFADAEHTELFDFSAPITGETNIYVSRSEGLYLSDYEEEGLLSSASLSDYLTSANGSYNPEMGTEEGWVEEYVIEETGEKCTYVNFGINPQYGDGYVELSLMLDISHSQIIRLTFKNIGSAKKINCYFTAMLSETTYSETGSFYTSNFNWPNYIGGPVGDALSIPSQMSETDEWITVDFNLYEVYKNGYSIWGTSPYLGAIRIEANHKNTGDDWSNEMLIKSIEGIYVDVPVEDSEEAQEVLGLAMSTFEDEVIEAGANREELANGIDFVKDYQSVGAVKGEAEVFPTTEGLLMYAENEILARESSGATKGFVMNLPEGREISFETLTTLNITLQNYGYQDSLTMYVFNDQGVPITVNLEINTKMFEPKTYVANLYGLFGVEEDRKFTRIEFIYTSKGVDNMILFKEITFTDFRPYDTVGINLNDKFAYGFESNSDVAISYNSGDRGTDFEVINSGAVIESSTKSYYATNDGYSYISLKGRIFENSNVSKVTLELLICKERNRENPEEEVHVYGTPYVFEITTVGALDIKLPLIEEEGGFVMGARLTFEGTGAITIKEFAYSINETSLPFYSSYDLVYNSGHTDWKGTTNVYEYDAKEYKSTFIKDPLNSYLNFALYIGFSEAEPYLQAPQETMNVYVPANAKRIVVTVVYQNRESVADMGIHFSFDETERSPGDGSKYAVCQNHGVVIDSEMVDYEWSAVTVVVEGDKLTQYLDSYLAKVNFEFHGDSISLRAVRINVEV